MIVHLPSERWAPVLTDGYALLYEVSTEGRVACVDNSGRRQRKVPFLLTPRPGSWGYLYVRLFSQEAKTTRNVHRLVLESFCGFRPPGKVARHLNGDRTDNRLQNLAWGTQAENVSDTARHGRVMRGEKHVRAKLTAHDVLAIRSSDLTEAKLADMYGVSTSAINHIRAGRSWRSLLEAA